MRRRLALLLMLILLTVMTSGCYGARETDEIAYVLAIGIDQSDEPNYYNFTYQIAVARALAGGPQTIGSGKPEQASILVTLKAQSLAEGRNLLNAAVSRVPILSHTKIIILGEELARAGIGKVISPLMRFREFRGSMFIMVANDATAAQWMKANIPKLELLAARFYESTLLVKENSYYLKTHINDFYINLKTQSASPYAALGGIEKNPPPAKDAMPPARFDEYIGNTPRVGNTETPAEFVGLALFRADKMVGKLTSNETRMLAMLLNDFNRGFLVADDPLVPKNLINVAIRLGEPVKKAVKFSDGRAIITIDVFLECEISAIPSGIQYEHDEYRQLLEEQISIVVKDGIERLMSKLQRLGCDTAGFGYRARRNFTTLPEWEAFDWYSAYKQAEVNVSVKTRIRRHGLLWKTSPLNKD